MVFYGTMEGWLKAVNAKTGEILWKFKTPSGIIGNPMTYTGPDGKQYVAVLSGIGGWSGIGVAADIGAEDPTAALGALGAFADVGKFQQPGWCPDGLRASVRRCAKRVSLVARLCVCSPYGAVSLWLLDRAQKEGKKQFRVCADPENLPFSNQKLEGFREQDRELIAKEFGAQSELRLVGTTSRVHPEHHERHSERGALRRRDRRSRRVRSGSNH